MPNAVSIAQASSFPRKCHAPTNISTPKTISTQTFRQLIISSLLNDNRDAHDCGGPTSRKEIADAEVRLIGVLRPNSPKPITRQTFRFREGYVENFRHSTA